MTGIGKLAAIGLAVTLVLPAQAARNEKSGSGARRLPSGVTRMTIDDRMTQCQAMLPGVVEHMRDMERARGDGMGSGGAGDTQAHEMSLLALRECRNLMTEMIARLQQMERAPRGRR